MNRRRFLGIGVGAAASLAVKPVLSFAEAVGIEQGATVRLHMKGGGVFEFVNLPVVRDAVNPMLWRIPNCTLEAVEGILQVERVTGTIPEGVVEGVSNSIEWPLRGWHGPITLCHGDSLTVTGLTIEQLVN